MNIYITPQVFLICIFGILLITTFFCTNFREQNQHNVYYRRITEIKDLHITVHWVQYHSKGDGISDRQAEEALKNILLSSKYGTDQFSYELFYMAASGFGFVHPVLVK